MVNSEERSRRKCVLDVPWSDRVCLLTKGCRVVTENRQTRLRLEGPTKANGVPLLATKKSATESISVAWGSCRLEVCRLSSMRICGNRSLALCSFRDRDSVVFEFESNEDLLAWSLTLRILAAPYIDERRPLAEIQRRYYYHRAAEAPQTRADDDVGGTIHPLQELCPVLYPLADRIRTTCDSLGISFSNEASASQKLLVWTAVAVLEAKEPYDVALNTMRSLLHDFGCSDINGTILPRVDDSHLARCFGHRDDDDFARSSPGHVFCCLRRCWRRRREETSSYVNVVDEDDDVFLIKQRGSGLDATRTSPGLVVASHSPTVQKTIALT